MPLNVLLRIDEATPRRPFFAQSPAAPFPSQCEMHQKKLNPAKKQLGLSSRFEERTAKDKRTLFPIQLVKALYYQVPC
jgi:hypothetical protein